MTPYHFSVFPANVNQTMWVIINPPDNIESVVSALFHFKVLTGGATTNYQLYVNDKLCGNYLIHTSYANAGQFEIAFDCTNLITKTGNYTVKIISDKDAGDFFGWIDLTYISNPVAKTEDILKNVKAEISVGGTDYVVGDTALIHATVRENLVPVTNAFCDYNVFYPNKTFFRSGIMEFIPFSRGLYANNFTIPNITGVYPMEVVCVKPTNSSIQPHYFSQQPVGVYGFENKSGNAQNSLYFPAIEPDQSIVCHALRFNEYSHDYQSGEFKSFRHLGYIGNVTGYWSQVGGSANYVMYYRYYKVTQYGNIYLGASQHDTLTTGQKIDTTIRQFKYTDLFADMTWLSTDLLQVEICARKVDGGAVDLYYYYNSSVQNSSFSLYTISVNATTLDFEVGSSSELNVKYIGGSQTIDTGNISNIVLNVNSSIFGKLFGIQDEITSVNNTVKDVNYTLSYQIGLGITTILANINSNFNSILGNLTIIYAQNSINFNSIIGNLTSVNDTIKSIVFNPNITVNATLNISNVFNATIYNQTVNVTNVDILNQTINVSVTNQTVSVDVTNVTVNATNVTVNNLLNVTIFNNTVNVTNVDIQNITINNTVLNESVEVNVANYTINVTTVDVQNITVNVTNVNVINETVNISVTNTTANLTETNNLITGLSNDVQNNFTQLGNNMNNNFTYVNTNIESVNDTVKSMNQSLSTLFLEGIGNLFNTMNINFNSIIGNITSIVFNPNITVNTTNNITIIPNISVTNQTVEVNVINQTVNVTNVDVQNVTTNITVLNETVSVNVNNYTVNVTNVDIQNITNNITVINQTSEVNVANYTINVTTVDVQNVTVNVTNVNVENITNNVTVINTSTDLTPIQNQIGNLSNDMSNNFTNTNNQISNVDSNMANNFTNTNNLINNLVNQILSPINNWIYGNFTYTNSLISQTPASVWNYTPRTVENVTIIASNITLNATVTSISDEVADDLVFRIMATFRSLKNELLTIKLFG